MKFLAVGLLLIASVLSFSITHISLLHHDETLRALEDRCKQTNLNQRDPLCSKHLSHGLNTEYYFKITRFVSVIAGISLVGVAMYMIWSAARDWEKTESECRDKETKLARMNGVVGAYKKKMQSNKRVECKQFKALDHYKMDMESAQQQQEDDRREITYLSMASQRLHVRGRVNWARMIQHRRKEETMRKKLESNSKMVTQVEERLVVMARENERLNNELRSEKEARDIEKHSLDELLNEAWLNNSRGNSSLANNDADGVVATDYNVAKDNKDNDVANKCILS